MPTYIVTVYGENDSHQQELGEVEVEAADAAQAIRIAERQAEFWLGYAARPADEEEGGDK